MNRYNPHDQIPGYMSIPIRPFRSSCPIGCAGFALLTALLMIFSIEAIYTQHEYEIVTGRVVRLEDSMPVPGAHIINTTRERGTITNDEGLFSIYAGIGDSLLISVIGFISDTIDITMEVLNSDVLLTLKLEQQIYDIDAVDIYPLPPTYAGFRREFIYGFDSIPQYYSVIREFALTPTKSGPAPVRILGSPITYFYNLLSREGREIRKYREVLREESKRAGYTLNYDLVRMITGLEEEEEIIAFFYFCEFTAEMLATSTEIEVTEAISECYNKFNQSHEDIVR